LWVVIFQQGVTGAILGFFISITITVVIGLFLLFRRGLIGLKLDLFFARDAARFGFKAHIGDIAQYLIYRSDVFIINYFAGAGVVGQYAIAVRIAELLWLPSNTLRMALLARTASSSTDSRTFAAFISRNMLFYATLFGCAILLAGSLLIHLVLPRYLPSIQMLMLLLPGAIAVSVFRTLVGTVVGDGNPGQVTRISLVGFAAGTVLYLLLIPYGGGYGAAIASSILYIGEFAAITRFIASDKRASIRQMILIQRSDIRLVVERTRHYLNISRFRRPVK
jgi:O-antigen/teichoic acid export membrane protein